MSVTDPQLTNPQYLNLLFHVNCVNAVGRNFIHGDIEKMERRTSRYDNSPRSYPEKAVFNFLNDEIGFSQFAEQATTETRNKVDNYIYSAEDAHESYYQQFNRNPDNKPVVGLNRIMRGFESGAIDYISGALVKTDKGWIDDQNQIMLNKGASIEDVFSLVKRRADIVAEFSTARLEQAEHTGTLSVGTKEIAHLKDVDGQKKWIDTTSKRMFDHGDLIRLLHHRDEPLIIYTSKLSHDYYHGAISPDSKPLESLPVREGMSIQGDGVYGTASVNEAVKIYGNPYSFESRSKLLSLKENQGVDDSTYDKGLLFSMTTTANIYNATLDQHRITFNDIPSLPLVLALSHSAGLNQVFATNKWVDMKNSSSTYEVYQHMQDLTTGHGNRRQDLLKSMLLATGFEGIELEVPASKLEDYKYKLDSVKNKPEIIFEKHGLKKDEVIKQINHFIKGVESAIMPKAEVSHLIVFNEDKVQRSFLAMLPPAVKVPYGETPPDNVYYSKEPLTLNAVLPPKDIERNNDMSLSI